MAGIPAVVAIVAAIVHAVAHARHALAQIGDFEALLGGKIHYALSRFNWAAGMTG